MSTFDAALATPEPADLEAITEAPWELLGDPNRRLAIARYIAADWAAFFGPWESRRPAVVSGVSIGYCLEQHLDTITRREPMIGRDIIAKNGEALDPLTYVRLSKYDTGAIVGRWKSAQLVDYLRSGATLISNGLESSVRSIATLADALEQASARNVQCNSYLVDGAVPGFAPHTDPHNALVVQVHGRKRWQIWSPSSSTGLSPDLDIELGAGDGLLLPQGWWHLVSPVSTTSLHLTFSIDGLSDELTPSLPNDDTRQVYPLAASDAFRFDLSDELGRMQLSEAIGLRATSLQRLRDELAALTYDPEMAVETRLDKPFLANRRDSEVIFDGFLYKVHSEAFAWLLDHDRGSCVDEGTVRRLAELGLVRRVSS